MGERGGERDTRGNEPFALHAAIHLPTSRGGDQVGSSQGLAGLPTRSIHVGDSARNLHPDDIRYLRPMEEFEGDAAAEQEPLAQNDDPVKPQP